METFKTCMDEYNKQISKGYIQAAYRCLIEYIRSLKAYFDRKYPECAASSGFYQGYMDMTYFPLFPKRLKIRNLKIAIVYIHGSAKFEIWLAGTNRKVQAEYWKLFKQSKNHSFRIPALGTGTDSIVEYTLVEHPDFGDLEALTRKIEKEALYFISEVENFLSQF